MNWIAIIIATVAAMVIGFLWYGPVFGKSWMALSGRGMGDGSSPGPLYALTALAAFVEAVAVNWFINETGWTSGAARSSASMRGLDSSRPRSFLRCCSRVSRRVSSRSTPAIRYSRPS